MDLECEPAPILGKKNELIWSRHNGDIQFLVSVWWLTGHPVYMYVLTFLLFVIFRDIRINLLHIISLSQYIQEHKLYILCSDVHKRRNVNTNVEVLVFNLTCLTISSERLMKNSSDC
jgi:hypothetical protein